MKPTSVIFIIISVMLAAVGILLMVTASNMADNQGVALFSQTGDENSNYVSVKDFDGESIKKIVLNLSSAEINIYGGSDKNKIELVNFPDGTYDYTTSKSTLQLSDTTSITNIVDIDNMKINFNGFRDYLHYFKYRGKQQTVNLYLTDDAAAIILNVSTGGNVNLQNLRINCDYKIKTENGDVTVDNVKTDSSIFIESTGDSEFNFSNVTVNEIELNGVTAYAKIKNSTVVRAMFIKFISGDVDYDRLEPDFTGFNVYFETVSGIINYGGEKIINSSYKEENYVDIGEITENDPDEYNEDDYEEDYDDEDPSDEETVETTAEETNEAGEFYPGSGLHAHYITIVVKEGNITVH